MCGRFALTASPDQIRALFQYEQQPNFPPRTNVSPTEPIAMVASDRGTRSFRLVRWGFIPSWVKDTKAFPLLINARGETLATKPAFRNAIRRRRCIVPADAFYEWKREGEGRAAHKQPYLIRRRDGRTMGLAGLWETYVSPDGGEIDTALIVTTGANGAMAAIHDRMPVILKPEQFDLWLDCANEDPGPALQLVRPCADDVIEMEPCDPRLPQPERRAAPAPRPSSPELPPREPVSASRKAGVGDAQGSLF
ncbi:DUF159 family protein [Alsobacter metallidurans]|uniref:Abasic site processing protein n=1 Tax=Alsobacter metallidurans TaxID=340221 RepID=A0A917MHL6_9HYPH|nr:SOS response-associated peptidase [Alsobacter metallidurans]GGH15749.1 DUF159 family protein [Alsobacter metallidurans]